MEADSSFTVPALVHEFEQFDVLSFWKGGSASAALCGVRG